MEEICFGKNSKFMIVRYALKLEIYLVQALINRDTKQMQPKVVTIQEGMIENICDIHFETSDVMNDFNYSCYLACRVYHD